MSDYINERELERKREYHRKWRAEHRDSVAASQLRYWSKKAEEMRSSAEITAEAETEAKDHA